jgi:hypothetical protein
MGFLDAISAKISAMRQRAKDKKRFLESLLRAADDGKFTDDEIKELESRYKELELTENDIKLSGFKPITRRFTPQEAMGAFLPKKSQN